MKNIQSAIGTFACALACSMGLTSCETAPRDKATAVVTAPYPGRNVTGACGLYANALYKALAVSHIRAWCVLYWRNDVFDSRGHAMVVYKDAGAYWCADNEFPYPTRCEGTTPMEWAQERDATWLAGGGDMSIGASYSNPNTIVSAFAVKGSTLLAGHTHRANHAVDIAAQHHHRHQRQIAVAGKTSQGRYANQ